MNNTEEVDETIIDIKDSIEYIELSYSGGCSVDKRYCPLCGADEVIKYQTNQVISMGTLKHEDDCAYTLIRKLENKLEKKENKMNKNIKKEETKAKLKELISTIRKTKLDIKNLNRGLSKTGNTEELGFYKHIYQLETDKIKHKNEYRILHLASCLVRKINYKELLKLNNDIIQSLILEFGLEKKGKEYNKPNIEQIREIMKTLKEEK